MTRPYNPIDPARIKTYSVQRRAHRASVASVASLPAAGASAADLIDSLPDYLGAKAFRRVVEAVVQAGRATIDPWRWRSARMSSKSGADPS